MRRQKYRLILGISLVFAVSAFAQSPKVTKGKTPTYKTKATASNKKGKGAEVFRLTPEQTKIFDQVEYKTFQYFWQGAEQNSGMACERIHMDNNYPEHDQHIVTTGGSGFGVMAILAGMYRGWISEDDALARYEKILKFLDSADRFHGAWPHWIDGETGHVKPFGKKDDGGDLVETSFLMQGLICVKEYFTKDLLRMTINAKGTEAALMMSDSRFLKRKFVVEKIDQFWRNIEFDWYTNGKKALYWHWSPNYGWQMNFQVRGYNECLIMYVLAASSPTHPISKEIYDLCWADSGKIEGKTALANGPLPLKLRYQGNPPNGGPLFWAHYSYLGLCPFGLRDKYTDYWRENVNLTLRNYLWCKSNPKHYKGYGANSWGLTASYSLGFYAAHAPDSANDLGVISPTAALSSFPYTPKESAAAMVNWYKNKPKLLGQYGFYDAFSDHSNWMLPHYLAIDQGPTVVMMENFRSKMFWKLFMGNSDIQRGLTILGFDFAHVEDKK